jgi:hypothetical protein
MSSYDIIFNRIQFYDLLFIKISCVTEYESLNVLASNNPKQYNQWINICKYKYNCNDDSDYDELNKFYLDKGVFYPEFSKIVGITTATVMPSDTGILREFKDFIYNDEYTIISKFIEHLNEYTTSEKLCGYNIVNQDIPLFLKRLIHLNHDNKLNIPNVLKVYLKSKPWDDNFLDLKDILSFKGINTVYLNNIIDFYNLKTNIELLNYTDFNMMYWKLENNERYKLIREQTANLVNIYIQIAHLFKNF